MKQHSLLVIAFALIIVISSQANAQLAFGIEGSLAPEKEFAKVTLPAPAFADAVNDAQEGIDARSACLLPSPTGVLEGYQADFDGDGKEEMMLLYHNGPADAGCNVLAALAPIGGGKYRLYDLLTLPGGRAAIRPIVVLDKGVQMYVQNTYALPSGNTEHKGIVISFQQTAILILTSWTQKEYAADGKNFTQEARVVFNDLNFDNRKELIVQYSIHEGTRSSISDKNLVDQYVLTLDFMPEHLRYAMYDSAGIDKLKEAEAKAKSGERMIHREATRVDGIVKIREALRVNPFLTPTRVALGTHFLMSGKYGDAEATLLAATEFDPRYAKAYKMLGDTYLRLNDLQKALAAYTTYLELDPNARDRKKVEHNIKQITIPKRRR